MAICKVSLISIAMLGSFAHHPYDIEAAFTFTCIVLIETINGITFHYTLLKKKTQTFFIIPPFSGKGSAWFHFRIFVHLRGMFGLRNSCCGCRSAKAMAAVKIVFMVEI
ncbi:MAG: hypothetical protein IPQ11_14520 [Bacteroidetes bacterium]|nr:hypothetical protein [Bacteroidota bacterium]